MAGLKRLLPRFSLRTLVVFLLLVTSGVGLWWSWEPWYVEREWKADEEFVRTATFSPDEKKVVTAGVDTVVRIWDASTGTLLVTLSGHEDWVGGAYFTQDGSRVVTASHDDTIRVWNALTGQCLSTVEASEAMDARFEAMVPRARYTIKVRYHPRHLGVTMVIDLQTDQVVAVLPDIRYRVSAAGISADASRILATRWTSVFIMRRRRPEWWWGVFWLWEFWLTAAFAAIFVWSVVRDRRRLARAG